MRFSTLRAVVVSIAAAIACDDGGTVRPSEADGGAAPPGFVDPRVFQRGEYLVRNVAGCGECHTPRDALGNLDQSQWLGGVKYRFDLVPDDPDRGGLSAPNLTPAALSTVPDDAIKHAFLDGVGLGGEPLFPLMPYYAFHNMTPADADAIVVYLRNVPAIVRDASGRQPLPVRYDAPVAPIPDSAIPHTTLPPSDAHFAAAERGRYLAGEVGFCLDCHTQWRLGANPPLDLARAFAGWRGFSAGEWGVPPPAPAVVYSYNVTPHASGIAGWKVQAVADALAHGVDDQGQPLCRPMPSGPLGAFGGMTIDDARDIGTYLTTIPPIDSGDIPTCP